MQQIERVNRVASDESISVSHYIEQQRLLRRIKERFKNGDIKQENRLSLMIDRILSASYKKILELKEIQDETQIAEILLANCPASSKLLQGSVS